MTTVQLPDGSTVSFPDGTGHDEMLRAVETHLGANAATPPPGVMIHDTNQSYVTGPDGAPAMSVDTSGMNNDQRTLAAAGLHDRRNVPSWLSALAPMLQGVSMGYGDEAVSAAKGATNALSGGSFSDAYNVAQEAQRQMLAQQRAEHPYRSAALQIGGALTQAPALAALGGSGAGLPLAGRMATGAGTGALYGGVEGFGSGSGLEDRLKQAGTGAVIGGGVGAAVPVAETGAKALTNKILDQFTVNSNLRQLGIDRPAADTTMRALSADDAFSGAGAQNIAAAGPDAMLVDAGPSTRGALDTAMQRGGPATLAARRAVDARGASANRTLQTALDSTLGAPEGVDAASANIRSSTAAARDTAYKAAYNAPVDYLHPQASDLESLLQRVPGKALGKANELMQLEGAQSKQILANVAPDGTVAFQRMPDVQQIDYITRGLRQLAESGEDVGKLGGRTDFSRAYTNLSRDIRGTLRDIVPEYGTALDTAADPISRIQAMRVGSDMLKPGTGRDEVAMSVAGMTQPELQAVRQGVRSYVDDLMANVRAAASDPNQDAREAIFALRNLNSRATREKLSSILDPPQAGFLTRELGRASKAAELYAGTTRNSATYGRMAVDQANQQMQEPGIVGSLMEGKPVQATQRATQFAFGTTPQDKLAAQDEMHRQLAELLTGRQGPDALSAMQTLTDAYQTGQQNAGTAAAIGRNLGLGSGLVGYQLLHPLSRGK